MRFIRLWVVLVMSGLVLGSTVGLAQDLQPIEIARLSTANPMIGDDFGSSVSATNDRIAIGASTSFSHDTGFASVFRRDDNGTPLNPTDDTWIEEARLFASDADNSDLFGLSIELTDRYLVVGAPTNDDVGISSGSAYVFWRDENGTPLDPTDDTWIEVVKLLASDPIENAGFGDHLAMSGDRLVLGAAGRATDGLPGAAYVLRHDDNGTPSDPSDDLWIEEAKLIPSDVEATDLFGFSVAIHDEWAIIGSMNDDDSGAGSGSAYVFRRDDNGSPDDPSDDAWIEHAKLVASDGSLLDSFGWFVCIDGDRAVIGAAWDDHAAPFAGSAYVFRRDDNGTPSDSSDDVWIEEAKLVASDASEDDQFGTGVSIKADVVLVGAPGHDDVASAAGAAYLFRRDNNGTPGDATDDIWIEDAKLIASNASQGYQLGVSVDLGGLWGVVSSPVDGEQAWLAGSAFVYYVPTDCNANGIDDLKDIAEETSGDCNGNLRPDECEPDEDCNTNGFQDICDIAIGTSGDCNSNSIPDECDITGPTSGDCNVNDTPDECESDADCNLNQVQDFCDIALGTSGDCNDNDIPDECEPNLDCNTNGFQDICDIALGTSPDVDGNGIPDECCFASNPPLPEMIGSAISAKNRFLSIRAGDSGRMQAIRVTAVSLPAPFDVWNGQRWFVGQPMQVCENSGQGLEVSPPDCGPAPGLGQKWFWAAPLSCSEAAAYFTEWVTLRDYCTASGEACVVDADCSAGTCGSDGIVHLYHEGVIPSRLQVGGGAIQVPANYEVQVVDSMCSPSFEPNYSDPLSLTQAGFGDVVATPGVCPLGGPNQDVSLIGDVTEALRRFSNQACAPKKARVEMEPAGIDFTVNISDVLRILNAFTGGAYPNSPGADSSGAARPALP